MRVKQAHKKLFEELEQWSGRKDAFSINDFLKERGVSFSDFELIANNSSKLMKIWEIAESRAWENLKDALFKKSLPRHQIAEYIKESDAFQGIDPEETMNDLERSQAKLELYLTAIGDTKSLLKYGRIGCKLNDGEALMQFRLECGAITRQQYEEYVQIEQDYRECNEDD